MSDLISRDKLNECIKRWYEHMGVDTHGVWNKQLAEIVKDMGEDDLALEFRFFRESIGAIPSAEAESNDLIIKGAKGIKDGLYNIKDGKLFQYKAKGGTVRTYQIIKGGDTPSAEAVQGWIPCSERLPEDSGDYLVCPSDGVIEDYSDCSDVMIMPYDADCEAFGCWTERYDPISLGFVDSDFDEFEVLAWMPLPKPYREDGEE